MRGFLVKLPLGWSEALGWMPPLLASSSVEGIVVWSKQTDESLGWSGRVLTMHKGVVQAISFQPSTFLLASAAEDGGLFMAQAISPGSRWCSRWVFLPCLASQGQQLAAGGQKNCWFGQNLWGQDLVIASRNFKLIGQLS